MGSAVYFSTGILLKSVSNHFLPVRNPVGPNMVRFRFKENDNWVYEFTFQMGKRIWTDAKG